MSTRDRRYVRYGVPAAAVIVGVLIAATLTNGLGNTLATVLIGGGLLAFVVLLLRDMGLLDTRDRTQPPAEPPADTGDSHHGSGPDHGSDNGSDQEPSARRTVSVPRPDRMRGQRRRLR